MIQYSLVITDQCINYPLSQKMLKKAVAKQLLEIVEAMACSTHFNQIFTSCIVLTLLG